MNEPTLGEIIGMPAEPGLVVLSPQEQMLADELAMQKEEDRQLASLQAFGALVQGMVDEAVRARDASGIEARWVEDLRQYYGSDWSLMSGSGVVDRAVQQDASANSGDTRERQPKSRIIVNITRPKTNAVMARLADMLLPTDDKNWGIFPTPNPDLLDDLNDEETIVTAGGAPLPGKGGEPMTKAQLAQRLVERARKACDAMARAIDDSLVECNYNAEFRRGLWFFTVLGTMVMRGPFARVVEQKRWQRQPEGWALTIDAKEVPASECVNPWNFYPDPACGGDIRNARYVAERMEFNGKTLGNMRGQPGFIDSQINLCLLEGPKGRRDRGQRDQRSIPGEYEFAQDAMYDVWMVHGDFTKGEMEDAGVEECACETDDERLDVMSGCVYLCNGRVIKAHLNPLDTGEIPYDVAQYERIDGQVFGVGCPFILRNPARVVTAGWRMVMDNSVLSAGAQIVYNRKLVDPADGSERITGIKLWAAKDGTEDVQKVFSVFNIPTRTKEIMEVIERALRFAEDESSMPAIVEGGQDRTDDRLGVANMRMNNANTVLRRLVKAIDDNITDPHITRHYHWQMQHSDDESIKGDFQVDARGTSVLMVRDGQRQSLLQVGQFVLHPLLGKFHKRAGFEWLKTMYESHHIDASSLLVADHEVEAIVKKLSEQPPPPPPPQIAVAEIRGKVEQAKLQATMQDADRERQFDMMKFDKQLQFEMLRYSNEQGVTLEETKNRMTELLLTMRDADRERMHKERMQANELEVKQRLGSGI